MQNSIGHIKYVLLIGRDVTHGKHHVMKSSRPSPSFLCLGSKVAIHLSRAGREKAWSRGYSVLLLAGVHVVGVLPLAHNAVHLHILGMCTECFRLSSGNMPNWHSKRHRHAHTYAPTHKGIIVASS